MAVHKRAREEGGEPRQPRGKRRPVEEQGAGEAAGAPRPASPCPEPTLTDWGLESPLPRWYAPQPVRREPWTVLGWRAGEVVELVCYVKWAGRRRGGQERRGTRPLHKTWPAGQGGHRKSGLRWRRAGGGGCWGRRSQR